MPTNKPQAKVTAQPAPEAAPLDLQKALEMLAKLQAKQEEMEAKLAEKDQLQKTTQAELDELTKDQEGWLVTTLNPTYDETTAGIKFLSGMAFLPSSSTYPLLGGKAGNKAFTPSAAQVAKYLHDDFGYEIQFFSYEELKRLKGRMDERKNARRSAEETMRAQQEEMLRQSAMPRRLGV